MKKTGLQIPALLMFLLLVLLTSCENDLLEQAQTARMAAISPVLTTVTVTNINTSTASAGGDITSDGGFPLIARGICWSTSPNPTVGGSHLENAGVAEGSYSDLMTGLAPGTLYYVRAYATNSVATGYGTQKSFITMPSIPPAPTVTPVGYPSGSGKAVVSWTNENGSSTYYDLYCNSEPNKPDNPNYISIHSESITVTGLTDYDTNYFWVVAKNATGTTSASDAGTGGAGIPVTSIVLDRVPQVVVPGYIEVLTATVLPEDATNPNLVWGSGLPNVVALSNVSNTVGLIAGGSVLGSSEILIATADNQGAFVRFTVTYNNGAPGNVGPAGGTIIYNQGSYVTDGWKYLEVASEFLADKKWQNGYTFCYIPGAQNPGEGAGKENTNAIINALGDGDYMAMACRNYRLSGYADWYMPSQNEVVWIFYQLGMEIYSGYWWFMTSTQHASYTDGNIYIAYRFLSPAAWTIQNTYYQNSVTITRPVRRF